MPESSKVLIAISGGADSVCLLHVLKKLGYECECVHCNFHLRGEESMRDEMFVRNLCASLNIPLTVKDFDTENFATENHLSIELAARNLRYDYFAKHMKEHAIKYLAVGHHKGDNAETMLLNLTRGTGIKGLCAIQPKSSLNGDANLRVVRPMLCLSHEEIEEYLKSIKQDWITDSTNLIDEASRNKIRLNIIPLLQKINPAVLDNIATTIENLNEIKHIYENAIAADIKKCLTDNIVDVAKLLKCTSPSSVLHEIVSEYEFNRAQEIDILKSCKEDYSGRIFSSPCAELLVDRKKLIIRQKQHTQNSKVVSLSEYNGIKVSKLSGSRTQIIRDNCYAFIDADKIKNELTVRTPLPGDSFAPFGMHGKRKLLSDFLTNLKKSVFDKQSQPLVMDGEEIVWVAGERVSELYKIDERTSSVLIFQDIRKKE